MNKFEWLIVAISAALLILLVLGFFGFGNPLLAVWNAVQAMAQGAGAILIFLVLGALYLLPTVVAWANKHHNTTAICLLNLLLGWTLLGWIGALVWAAMKPPPKEPTMK